MNKKLKARIVEIYGVQGNFAIALSINESVISRAIHGRKELSKSERERWAEALGCQPENIFENKSKTPQ